MTALLFLASFAVYLATMAPSITVGDSGEFCASAAILGICHSPGYPLFSLIGKAASLIFPLSGYAYRINLVSALAASAAVAVIYSSFKDFKAENGSAGSGGRFYLGLTASALFAFSPAFWRSAVQAEVFALNALFAALIVYSVLRKNAFLSFFAFGLGMGNHHTLVFALPLLASGWLAQKGSAAKKMAGLAAAAALGLSVYAYLPARAAKSPELNWGNPVNARNFIRVVTRADYGSLSLTVGEKTALTFSGAGRQLGRFASAVKRQFTVFGLVLGVLGLYYGFKRRYPHFTALTAAWALAGPLFLLLANMPFNPETEGILERFYILVNLFWAYFVFVGIEAVLGRVSSAALKAAVLALTLAGTAAAGFRTMSWREYFLEYDYARNVLRTMPPESALFMDGGDDTFYGTAYLSFAEGIRKDVELHDRGGLVFKNIYGQDFRKLTRDEKDKRRHGVEKAYLEKKPVYFSTFNRSVMPGLEMAPDGLLYRPAAAGRKNSFFAYSLRGVYDSQYEDYRSRALAPVYPYFEAMYDTGAKQALWKFALDKWPDAMWLRSNIKLELLKEAYERYASGDFRSAATVYEDTLRYYPGDYETMLNLGVVREKMKEPEAAMQWYRKAAVQNPGKPDAYYNMAVVHWQRSEWKEAVRMFEKTLQADPGDTRAARYLPLARDRHRGNAGGKQ